MPHLARGQGSNQAHAARRYGLPTTLVGAVGDDDLAERALVPLRSAGVDLSALQRLPGQTGCAGIMVDARGENQIVVAPGVNLALRASHVSDDLLSGKRAVLLQVETDAAQNAALIVRAKRHGCLVVLNNAPARPVDDEVLRLLDVLVVNQTEMAAIAQGAGIAAADATQQVRELAARRRVHRSAGGAATAARGADARHRRRWPGLHTRRRAVGAA